MCHLQGRLRTRRFAAGAAAYCALVAAGLSGSLGPAALATLQSAASVVVTGALLPQLWLNERNKSSGGWSPITAGLAVAGNGVRVFTTLQLTQDGLLLCGFLAGLVVNLVLLGQVLYYGAPKGGETAESPA